MNDLDIAKICFKLYDDNPLDADWDNLWPHDGGFAARKRVGDVDVVIWRGSTTALDWIDDLDFEPVDYPVFGKVHAGFLKGVSAVWDQVDATLGAKVIISGHSLGAAHALLHAARHEVRSKRPQRVVVMGSPRPGFQKLADLLGPVSIASYKNGDDPVTMVPPTLPSWPYVPPRDFIPLDVAPELGDSWGVFARHRWTLYLQGIEAYIKDAR